MPRKKSNSILAWNCTHTDRQMRALGMCGACYLANYRNRTGYRWWQKYPQRAKTTRDKWIKQNRERRNATNRASARRCYRRNPQKEHDRMTRRRHSDLSFRLGHNMRVRINGALKGKGKSKKTFKLLGCNLEQFKQHLASLFQPGMTWENYGYRGWHVDHVIPCAKFDLSNPEDQAKCFHYTNLQPMWSQENWSKGARV